LKQGAQWLALANGKTSFDGGTHLTAATNLTDGPVSGNGQSPDVRDPRYTAPMSEPAPPEKPADPRPDDAPSKGDIAAIGIGCLVVIIFAIALVIVAMSRE
jgi:hypothetical protein